MLAMQVEAGDLPSHAFHAVALLPDRDVSIKHKQEWACRKKVITVGVQ